MDRDPLRQLVRDLYPKSSRWAKRVDQMRSDQIYAIYMAAKEKQEKESTREVEYEQGTLF